LEIRFAARSPCDYIPAVRTERSTTLHAKQGAFAMSNSRIDRRETVAYIHNGLKVATAATLIALLAAATTPAQEGVNVPDQIVIAVFPKLRLYGFCPAGGRFTELLKTLEDDGATGMARRVGRVAKRGAERCDRAGMTDTCLRGRRRRFLFDLLGLVLLEPAL
jgi:hypothetical protein